MQLKPSDVTHKVKRLLPVSIDFSAVFHSLKFTWNRNLAISFNFLFIHTSPAPLNERNPETMMAFWCCDSYYFPRMKAKKKWNGEGERNSCRQVLHNFNKFQSRQINTTSQCSIVFWLKIFLGIIFTSLENLPHHHLEETKSRNKFSFKEHRNVNKKAKPR